ncbi:MAG: tetratricopeptide repeat protein [Kofleriaceae bacterium]
MRWLWITAIALGAARGQAEPRSTDDRGEFWREVVEPHGAEVERLIEYTRHAMRIADERLQAGAEWAVDQRMRYFRDSYGMMSYARTLSPQRTEVLVLLGRAAEELGKTDEAIEAFEECVRIQGIAKASIDATSRLGLIRLRMGDRDAGIRWLRLAQGPLSAATAQPLVHLANALADAGDTVTAIDTLVNAIPSQTQAFLPQEVTLLSFALAVIYDRDEQRSAAFETLSRLQSTLSTSFYFSVHSALAAMTYTPAEDRYYYQALLYEAVGLYAEARAQWALYAASGGTWRGRAFDHMHAIDRERGELARHPRPTSSPPAPAPAPPVRLRRTP